MKGLGYLACVGALKRHYMVLVPLRGNVFGIDSHRAVLVEFQTCGRQGSLRDKLQSALNICLQYSAIQSSDAISFEM